MSRPHHSPHHLPKAARAVLTTLAAYPGHVVAHERIIQAVYGGCADGGPLHPDATIRSAVDRINRALASEACPVPVMLHRGVGYALDARVVIPAHLQPAVT